MKIKFKSNIFKLVLLPLLSIHSSGVAFDITVHETGPTAKSKDSIKKVESTYPIASPGDVECAKSYHTTRFHVDNTHAGILFSLIAKKRARVKIAWDNDDIILFPYPETRKKITFPYAGGVSRLFFRSPQPIAGRFYVLNDRDKIIQTCPYRFLPAKRFRQSINMNVNGTDYETLDDSLSSDDSNNISINYQVSTKNPIPDGGRWSFRFGLSQTENSRKSQRANGSLSYSW